MEGTSKMGRPHREWTVNITEWWVTGVELCCTGEKNVGGNGREGTKHQRALSTRFMMRDDDSLINVVKRRN